MKINFDDKRKIIYAPKQFVLWVNSFKENDFDKMMYYLYRFGFSHDFVDGDENIIKNYELLSMIIREKQNIARALLNGYIVLDNQSQKFYWRKKKEHLVWFEDIGFNENYLTMNRDVKSNVTYYLGVKDNMNVNITNRFTIQDAKRILKDDFDMFEKVEV